MGLPGVIAVDLDSDRFSQGAWVNSISSATRVLTARADIAALPYWRRLIGKSNGRAGITIATTWCHVDWEKAQAVVEMFQRYANGVESMSTLAA